MGTMKKYRVAQAGCGNRGKIHIQGFLENADRFEYVGLCDLDESKMIESAQKYGITAPLYTDAEKMLAETRPDVFCFITQPHLRLAFVQLGVKYGVRGIALEKPMATSLQEAREIKDVCSQNNIKAVICHQHKYLSSFRRLEAVVRSGELGRIEKIHVGTQAWMSQLGTHYMDYALWINGGRKAKWATGHVHGREKLTDSHPSMDYLNGTALLENQVRLYFECGYLSERHPENGFWTDDRLTVFGTQGYAWAECDGGWACFSKATRGELHSGRDEPFMKQQHRVQTPYIRDLADWLDDDTQIHPCNIDIGYHGFEILEGMCLSALDNVRIDFPIAALDHEDILKQLDRKLPAHTGGSVWNNG